MKTDKQIMKVLDRIKCAKSKVFPILMCGCPTCKAIKKGLL